MRKTRKLVSYFASAFIIVVCLAAVQAKAQNVLGEILRRMEVYNNTLQTLKADITMEKYNSQLNVTDKTKGNTVYVPEKWCPKHVMCLRVNWTNPDEPIVITGDKYEIYKPRLNRVIMGTNTRSKSGPPVGNALGFMNMSRNQLKANYDVVYLGEELLSADARTWHLELTPKSPTSYKKAELWVDSDGIPRQTRITEKNDDTTIVRLTNVKRNETIPKATFEPTYPGKPEKVRA